MSLQSITNILRFHFYFSLQNIEILSWSKQSLFIMSIILCRFLLLTDVIWRVQLTIVDINLWWRDFTRNFGPRVKTLDDVSENWDSE